MPLRGSMQLFFLTQETKGKGKDEPGAARHTSAAEATRAASGAQADSLSRFTGARRRADEPPPPKQARRRGGWLRPPLVESLEEGLTKLGEPWAPPLARALSPPSSSGRGPGPRSSSSGQHPARR